MSPEQSDSSFGCALDASNLALYSSERSQVGVLLNAGMTEDLKQKAGTLKDQEVSELEEKLPDPIQSLKEVGGCTLPLCLKARAVVQQ